MTGNVAAESVGSVHTALAHATRLLQQHPQLAAEQALEILRAIPEEPRARLVLGAARRLTGELAAALHILEPLAREQSGSPAAISNSPSRAARPGRRVSEAITSLRRALQLKPDSADAWRSCSPITSISSVTPAARTRPARVLQGRDPRSAPAGGRGRAVDNDLPRGRGAAARAPEGHPTDVAAIRMLAEVAARLGRYEDAEKLLARCLELAPSFTAARHNYAIVLHRQNKPAEALAQIDLLLAREPRNPGYRNLQGRGARPHRRIRAGDRASTSAVLEEYPQQPKVWMSYGHALKTAGRQAEASPPIAAASRWRRGWARPTGASPTSRPSASTRPSRGDAARSSRAPTSTDEDRLHLDFALGKALEDAGDYDESFAHYARGQRAAPRSPCPTTADDDQRTCSAARRCSRRSSSPRAPAAAPRRPIRSSSSACRARARRWSSRSWRATPLVEGTMELPDISAIARELAAARKRARRPDYPEVLAAPRARTSCARSARSTCAQTRHPAQAGRPFFIDKMPNNFAARRPDPPDPAEREDHRRAPPSARLLLLRTSSSISRAARTSPTTSTTSAATTATMSS